MITSFGHSNLRWRSPSLFARSGSIRTASDPWSISAWMEIWEDAVELRTRQSKKKWGTKKGAKTYLESELSPRTAEGITTAATVAGLTTGATGGDTTAAVYNFPFFWWRWEVQPPTQGLSQQRGGNTDDVNWWSRDRQTETGNYKLTKLLTPNLRVTRSQHFFALIASTSVKVE